MTVIVIGGLTSIYFEVLLNNNYKFFYDSLVERNRSAVWSSLLVLIFSSFLLSTNNSSQIILSDWLDLKLRQNISKDLFSIATIKIDSVEMIYSDQRIAEDVDIFTSKFAIIGITFIFMFLKSIIFFVILWNLSPLLHISGFTIKGSIAISGFIYFMIPSSSSYIFGLKMMRFEDKRRRAEAHMRYAIISALQIKKKSILNKFNKILNLIVKISSISMRLNFVANFINLGLAGMSFVIPFIFLLPSYLNGTILFGDVIKASGAFSVFQVSINYLHYNFREVVRCIAAFRRIDKFLQSLK